MYEVFSVVVFVLWHSLSPNKGLFVDRSSIAASVGVKLGKMEDLVKSLGVEGWRYVDSFE